LTEYRPEHLINKSRVRENPFLGRQRIRNHIARELDT